MDGLTSNPVSMFFAALIGFCIVILAMVMALQVFVTTLEFYVIAAVGLVFMPFGVLKPTSFLADNFYSAILAVGTKMMVLSAIVAATDPMIGAMGLTEQYSLNHLFGILMVMMAMTVLYLRGPSLAAGLMSGRASLSASSAMGAGRAVAAPVIGVGAGVAAGVAGGASGGAGMVASGGVGGALKKGGAGSAGAVIGAGLGGVSGAAGGLKEQASEIGRQSD
jgi:type IV secretion system protein TrbL